MTAMHNVRSVETQKERYSRELAAYTLRQWEMARQAIDAGNEKPQDKSPNSSSRSRPAAQDSSRSSRTSQGIQSIDYAPSLHSHGGNLKHERRMVTSGRR
ncbi:hypothetical protein AcW1_000327 [Taiwanofungus camphoratus]|nr:hypothetical protein AcW2_001178 [Antrodia cinnamomea]KAI0935956.1 hypothetical protein AcV5_004227 [Antrodia cinnamomea]KAI0961175.1 hypothetical protein AcV7_000346 [Antrodia cinnamomea]KAI0963172.1 hypothetical protein AcW1_000327 [Antrodia cinnamomea]